MATWRGWWLVNDRALLPGRVDDLAVTTPTEEGRALREAMRVRREIVVREEILPALRRLLAPGAHVSDLLRRTGLLALGKVAQTEADGALLVHWLTASEADLPVREAAALGLGLLRRSDPSRQMDPRILDALRARLTRVADDAAEADVVRATAAISLGLLGDQPFGEGIYAEGRLVTHGLWRNLKEERAASDLSVALLTALGMQPPGGVPDGVREALKDVVLGRSVLGREWSTVERSHALTALARLAGPAALTPCLHALGARRAPVEIRRAAFIALGRIAEALTERERLEAAGVVRDALPRARDPLTRGLAHIGMGRLVAAHFRAGDRLAGDLRALWRQLLTEARSGSTVSRGFAVLGVGLAVRPVGSDTPGSAEYRTAREEGEEVLLAGLEGGPHDAESRGAHAIALGLMQAASAVRPLVGYMEDHDETDALRHDAALALAQIGHRGPEVIRALQLALSERRRPEVQAGAALGLSLLHGPSAGRRLLLELERSLTTTDVLLLTEPLGYLGDPALARPLVDYALSTEHGDYPRAFMLVALGNLGDPERKPSLAALGEDANYPAASPTLEDVLSTR